jgi:hypothetical protein
MIFYSNSKFRIKKLGRLRIYKLPPKKNDFYYFQRLIFFSKIWYVYLEIIQLVAKTVQVKMLKAE